MAPRAGRNWGSFAEACCWTLGLLLVSAWAALSIAAAVGARHELERFAVVHAASQLEIAPPDQSLWSAVRVEAWQRLLHDPSPPPLGVLRIPRLRIEAAILAGTDDTTLDRGIGHIDETALPGEDGNAGLAAHRDSFFRPLKDIALGDVIELRTLAGRESYRVERTWIVEPDDVSVLDPTPARSLTLVTCYPFYFVGSAPQRFIVRAVSTNSTR